MRLALAVGLAAGLAAGQVLTNVKHVRNCEWEKPDRTVKQAFDDAFPGGFWKNLTYSESPHQKPVTGEGLVKWVQEELLGGPSPFGGDFVPVPWDAPRVSWQNMAEDQLEPLQYIGYTRRQVCYIVAKSLIGSGTRSYHNGLKRFLEAQGSGGCKPRSSDFGRSFWTLLAACSVDPSLQDGGPMLVASKGSLHVPNTDLLRDAAHAYPLSSAGLKVCRYEDGGDGDAVTGMPAVPSSRCQPRNHSAGRDFMSANTTEGGQAMQVMTQDRVGGKLFGVSCGFSGGQSERMAFYMPEVAALSFFLSHADFVDPQLRTPAWILGARPIMMLRDATFHSAGLKPFHGVKLTSDLVEVEVAGRRFNISNTKPVIAFSAETQNLLGMSLSAGEVHQARASRLRKQKSSKDWRLSFGHKVLLWYRGLALNSHSPDLAPMLKRLVTSVGVGPWAAGLSFGDPSMGFLAMWVGQAAAAGSWGNRPPTLDYYMYSTFVENPSSQCLVHSYGNCNACIKYCNNNRPRSSGYWLPQQAFMTADHGNPCLTGMEHECPLRGIEHIYWNWNDRQAGHLWDMVDYMAWAHRYQTGSSIFDDVINHMVSSASEAMTPLFPKVPTYQ